MTQRIVNSGSASLGGSITASSTSLTVTGSTLPTSLAAGEILTLVIENEIIEASAISGATISGLARGREGTTAASHAAGVPVKAQLTAGAIAGAIRRENVGTAVPTGGQDGDIKIGTGLLWVNVGGVWQSAVLKASGGGSSVVYPNTTTLTFTARPAIPALPGYLATVTDPTWGTRITRITNVNQDRHIYSRIPAWNSDGTKILMNFGTVSHHIIDAVTFANLLTATMPNTAIWSNQDPNKLFGCQGTALVSVNATTGAQTTIRTFTSADVGGVPLTDLLIGDYEGAISDDDRVVTLTTNNGSGTNRRIINYDIQNNVILGQIAAPSGMDNAQVSRLANYVIVVASGGTRKYVPNLSSFVTISTSTNHGDNALNAGGEEIYVMNNAPLVKSIRLVDNVAINLLGSSATAFEYGHVSGRAINRPGWVYLSVYDTVTTAGRPGYDQIIAVKTDGSGQVQVFGFANHGNGSVYASQPHAVPNRDGSQVLAASEWGATNVYDYLFKAA